MGERRLNAASIRRSSLTAGAAIAGTLLTIPVGGYVARLGFEYVGKPLANELISRKPPDGVSTVGALLAEVFLPVAELAFAIMISIAVAAPIFVLVPAATMAVALRLAKADLIMPTLASALVMVLVLLALVQLMPLPTRGWGQWSAFLIAVASGAFLGRLGIESWWPDTRRPTPEPQD
jgi:hypothetical protein